MTTGAGRSRTHIRSFAEIPPESATHGLALVPRQVDAKTNQITVTTDDEGTLSHDPQRLQGGDGLSRKRARACRRRPRTDDGARSRTWRAASPCSWRSALPCAACQGE